VDDLTFVYFCFISSCGGFSSEQKKDTHIEHPTEKVEGRTENRNNIMHISDQRYTMLLLLYASCIRLREETQIDLTNRKKLTNQNSRIGHDI